MKRRKNYRIKKSGFKSEERSRYHAYLIRYNRAAKRLRKKGLEMYDIKYSFEEFIVTYEATLNDMNAIMRVSKRPNWAGDVVGRMIDRQKYAISRRQAENIYFNYSKIKNIDERLEGPKPTITEIREGQFDFDVIGDYYHDLKDSGLSGSDAKAFIASEIFGSK